MSFLQTACLIATPFALYFGAYKAWQSVQVKAAREATRVAMNERDWYRDELKKVRKEFTKLSLDYIGLRNFKFRFQQFIDSTRRKKKDESKS